VGSEENIGPVIEALRATLDGARGGRR